MGGKAGLGHGSNRAGPELMLPLAHKVMRVHCTSFLLLCVLTVLHNINLKAETLLKYDLQNHVKG